MKVNKEQWLPRINAVRNSFDEAIAELKRHQSNHHSARVMRHRLEKRRYILDFIRALIEGEEVHPMTYAHMWYQFLVEYTHGGRQIDDSVTFHVGENAFAIMRRTPNMTLEKLRCYLAQFDCSFDENGNVKEGR